MKNINIALVILFSMAIVACKPTKKAVKTENPYSLVFAVPDSVSYSLGLSMGSYLKQQGISSMEQAGFGKGMREGGAFDNATDQSSLDSISKNVQTFMMEYAQTIQNKMMADTTYVPEDLALPLEVSTSFGYLLGANLIQSNLGKANFEKVIAGVNDEFVGQPTFEVEQYTSILETYFESNDSLRVATNEKYLADNKVKEGVITTTSGLQYKVITKGEGKMPTATDKVKVHYKGTFIDGKTFDSSYDRGEPISFPLNQVISGWTEGVSLMPVGSKYIFTIPYQLGYGERGSQSIPPKSTLVFVVELLDIEK
ncbi:MAG: FKBP-type peptidyl-prolyl cis-trans isomerase [Saprospiraceae bacterium]